MKRKQWLVFVMSVLLAMCSFPVYAANIENKKGIEDQQTTEEVEENEESTLELIESLEVQMKEDKISFISEISESEAEQPTEADSEEITDSDIASGRYGDIVWVINKDGKLTVTGTGEFAEDSYIGESPDYRAPWSKYAESIISAEVSVKNIKNLSYIFSHCKNIKNIDLSGLDMSDATNLRGMFFNCMNLERVDFSTIDTSKVTDMSDMFRCCIKLENIDLSKFDTRNVTDMNCMFYQCWALKNIDVSRFDTGNVTDMRQMFYDCQILENIDVRNFNTCNVRNMSGLFGNCYKLADIDISGFDTSNVTDMSEMFYACNMKGVNLNTLDTRNVTDMTRMFAYCTYLEQLDLSHFDLSSVIQAQNMLQNCSNLHIIQSPKNVRIDIQLPFNDEQCWYEGDREITFLPQNLSTSITLTRGEINSPSDDIANGVYEGITWKIDKDGILTVTGTGELSAISSENKDVYATRAPWYEKRESILSATLQVNGMKDAGCMFQNCINLKSINLKDFDTSQLTTMESMFYGCSSLESVDLSGFHTDHVTNLAYMFAKCSQLKDVDVSSFNTENVTKIDGMFQACSSLGNLDLSSFTLSNVKKVDEMFTADENLNIIYSPRNIVTEIALPASNGFSWIYNESEILSLPQNLGTSVQVMKVPVKNLEEPTKPEIITTRLEDAVQNVPYESKLQNNGWDSVKYEVSSGVLPEGINLNVDGTIYGITKETGTFQFTVVMEVKGSSVTAEKVLVLQVLNSSDRVVDAIDEPGYEIIKPIPDINIEKEVTDQLFISNGPFHEFRDAYIDGNKLTRNIDYTVEAGSTRITIHAETLEGLEKGKHTLGIEFRTEEGDLKRIAQNFNVNSGKFNNKGDLISEKSTSNNIDVSSKNTNITIEPLRITEIVLENNQYYSIFLPADNAILRLALFHKLYGENATILAYLDNGIGYSLNLNTFLSAGKDLNLSTKKIELADFAQNFHTVWLSVAQITDLNYNLGINLIVGTDYISQPAYIFVYDDLTNSFILQTETVVAANGNIGFYTQRLTDFIVMIAE